MGLDKERALRMLLHREVSLVGYILSIVGDEHLAEDIFQDLAVLVLQEDRELPAEERFMPWLYTVARNGALKALRSRRRRARLLDAQVLDLLEEHWRETDSEDQASLIEALRHCMSKLTERARQLLAWRYGESASCIDIARHARKSLNTIYVSMSRIQRSLAACVGRRRAMESFGRA